VSPCPSPNVRCAKTVAAEFGKTIRPDVIVCASYWPVGAAGVGAVIVPGAFAGPLVWLREVVFGAGSGGGVMVAVPFATPFDWTDPLIPFWKLLLVPIKEWLCARASLWGIRVESVGELEGLGLIGGVVVSGAGTVCVVSDVPARL
jgi:hypothetical protein